MKLSVVVYSKLTHLWWSVTCSITRFIRDFFFQMLVRHPKYADNISVYNNNRNKTFCLVVDLSHNWDFLTLDLLVLDLCESQCGSPPWQTTWMKIGPFWPFRLCLAWILLSPLQEVRIRIWELDRGQGFNEISREKIYWRNKER